MRKIPSPYALFIISLILFGTNGVVADGINLSSVHIVLLRTFFGSLLLIVAYLIGGGRYKAAISDRKQMTYILISGVSMGVSWIMLYEAYILVGVSVSSMIYYCGPALVMVLSPFIFNEKLTLPKAAGFIVVAVGAGLMCSPALGTDVNVMGYVYSAGSAVAHATMVIFGKLAYKVGGLENSSLQLLYSFLIVLLYVLITWNVDIHINASDWGNILFLGFVNTGLGCLLYFSTITVLSAQTVSISGYLEPLSAVVFSAILLGETMTVLQIVGCVLILAGAMYAEIHGLKKSENHAQA